MLTRGLTLAATLAFLLSLPAQAALAQTVETPHLVTKNGRHALMVDGAPYLILGGQANNSSNYPSALSRVWPAMADLKANTLAMSIAWEQIEPQEGVFDFSFVDTLIEQAREHDVRLVLLWFGTWKNTSPSYAPEWVKGDNRRFPRLTNKDGSTSYALSPHYDATREADKKAYVELVRHIKAVDGQRHTVIMLQVENEVGLYGGIRDYSPKAEALMKAPVPTRLIRAMGDRALKPAGNWHEVFGTHADEYFHAWSIAAFCDDIAAAGKAVYPLPTYMNAALKDPLNPDQPPGSYASGGPTYNVLDIYKVAAPHIDMLAPDTYMPASRAEEATLSYYARPDNPLYVAESGNQAPYARYLFSVLGRQGIGYDPFGMDYTGFKDTRVNPGRIDSSRTAPFATLFGVFGPMSRVWARLSFESQVWGVSEPDDHAEQTLDLGAKWSAKVNYRQKQFGYVLATGLKDDVYPEGSHIPSGGVALARLSEDEFLVIGHNARITFGLSEKSKRSGFQFSRVEEGHFDKAGNWVFERVWNGDQTDWGLNFVTEPKVLKVKLSSY